MDTQTSEIAEGIYRFSTFLRDIGPTGLTFNVDGPGEAGPPPATVHASW